MRFRNLGVAELGDAGSGSHKVAVGCPLGLCHLKAWLSLGGLSPRWCTHTTVSRWPQHLGRWLPPRVSDVRRRGRNHGIFYVPTPEVQGHSTWVCRQGDSDHREPTWKLAVVKFSTMRGCSARVKNDSQFILFK